MTTKELIEKMELIGLSVNNKPLSFSKFKAKTDAHQYGNRSSKIYIVYIGLPRQNLFGFYPPRTTKKESLEIAYQYYLSVFENEDYNDFTYGNIAWGVHGYPISYSRLR
jgi:hypothetical protein